MKIYFVRHGKDDDSYRGGWSNMDIIEEGHRQAKLLSEYLFDNKEQYNIKHIISSDLVRTMSTASYISQKLSIPIIQDPKIREMNNGDLAGMLNKTAEEKYPELYFNTLDMDEKYPNGESPVEFYTRIENWFSNLMVDYGSGNDNVLVVTHSGVINIIYYLINNMEWSNKTKPFRVSNCSVHILDSVSKKFECENMICW